MAAPASKRCRTENIIDVEQEELSFSVEWMNLKIPHFTQLYKMPNVIYDISFSSTSPDVLYILTADGVIHSLIITTLAVTKIIKLQSVRGLLCHNDILYISTSAAIYKYTTDGECLISINNDGGWWFGAVGKGDKLYYRSGRSIGVIDSDTMTLISTISLCHGAHCIAVSQDDKLHVATDNGVHIYRADGSYTGMVYLEGEICSSIACTSNGYIVVGMKRKVAVVSNDLTSTHYIILPSIYGWCVVRCSPVDNTLAIVDWNSGNRFILLPQETYQPPFSLSTLCKSTILSHPDVLLTTFLPPIIYRQFKHHINISVKIYRGEASRISPAAFEAVHAPVGNTHGTKRLAKPTQLQQHGARDPLKKWRYSVATMKTLHNHPQLTFSSLLRQTMISYDINARPLSQ